VDLTSRCLLRQPVTCRSFARANSHTHTHVHTYTHTHTYVHTYEYVYITSTIHNTTQTSQAHHALSLSHIRTRTHMHATFTHAWNIHTHMKHTRCLMAHVIVPIDFSKDKRDYTYIHIDLQTYVPIYIHTCNHTDIHSYVHTYKHTHTHTFVHTYRQTDRHTYTQMYRQSNILARIHVHTPVSTWKGDIDSYSFVIRLHLHTHQHADTHTHNTRKYTRVRTHTNRHTHIKNTHTHITHMNAQTNTNTRTHIRELAAKMWRATTWTGNSKSSDFDLKERPVGEELALKQTCDMCDATNMDELCYMNEVRDMTLYICIYITSWMSRITCRARVLQRCATSHMHASFAYMWYDSFKPHQ